MTIVTAPPSQETPPPVLREHQRLTSGHLPAWSPWGILIASGVLTALIFGVLAMADGSEFSIGGWAVIQITGASLF